MVLTHGSGLFCAVAFVDSAISSGHLPFCGDADCVLCLAACSRASGATQGELCLDDWLCDDWQWCCHGDVRRRCWCGCCSSDDDGGSGTATFSGHASHAFVHRSCCLFVSVCVLLLSDLVPGRWLKFAIPLILLISFDVATFTSF